MNRTKSKIQTKKSWGKKHNGAPIPLEAFGYPIQHKDEIKRIKKQNQDDYFNRHYDKLIEVEFKDKDQLNMDKHFYMPKLNPDWDISKYKNALAIYPVLCGRADFRDATKWVPISRENIGKLAGIWPGAVDKGISVLMKRKLRVWDDSDSPTDTPLLKCREWQDGQRRGHEYLPGFFRYNVKGLDPHQWKGEYFIFHTCIVNSGVWSKLSRKAKALYWAMRSKAFFDQQAYEYIEGVYIPSLDEIYEDRESYSGDGEWEKIEFRNRKWDVCNTSLKELFQLARVPYTDTCSLIDELTGQGLVERVHENKSVFKVFLRPEQLIKN